MVTVVPRNSGELREGERAGDALTAGGASKARGTVVAGLEEPIYFDFWDGARTELCPEKCLPIIFGYMISPERNHMSEEKVINKKDSTCRELVRFACAARGTDGRALRRGITVLSASAKQHGA
jgi:hypothetical protein